jgi:uncharacterized tellurite resistance protein B-like protein
MDVEALTHPERVALVVLLKQLVTADKQVSAPEAMALNDIARQVGPDVMRAADAVRLTDPARVSSFLTTVARPMAREIIYDALLEVAKADQIQGEEAALLDQIVAAWDVVALESHAPEG